MNLHDATQEIESRSLAVQRVLWICYALIVQAGILLCAGALAHWSLKSAWGVLILLSTLLWGAFALFVARQRIEKSGVEILDRHFALKERATTLSNLTRAQEPLAAGELSKAQLLQVQIDEKIPHFDVATIVPLTFSRRLRVAGAVALLAALIGVTLFLVRLTRARTPQAEQVHAFLIAHPQLDRPVQETLERLKRVLEEHALTDHEVEEALEQALEELQQEQRSVSPKTSEGKDNKQGSMMPTPSPSSTPQSSVASSPTPTPTPAAAESKSPSEKKDQEKKSSEEKKEPSQNSDRSGGDSQPQPSGQPSGQPTQGSGQSNKQQGDPSQQQNSDQGQVGGQQGSGKGDSKSGAQGDGKGDGSQKSDAQKPGENGQQGQEAGQTQQSGAHGKNEPKSGSQGKDDNKQSSPAHPSDSQKSKGQSSEGGQSQGEEQALSAAQEMIEQIKKSASEAKQQSQAGSQGESAAGKRDQTSLDSDKKGGEKSDPNKGQKPKEASGHQSPNANSGKDRGEKGEPSKGEDQSDDAAKSDRSSSNKDAQVSTLPKSGGQLKEMPGGSAESSLKGERGYQNREIGGGDETFDARFTDQSGQIARHKGGAQARTNLDDVKLAQPEAMHDLTEQPIPPEYRDIIQ